MLLGLALCQVQERLCESSVRGTGSAGECAQNSWIACASMADCAEVSASRVPEIIAELKAEGVDSVSSSTTT